jgi:hypothetical protein
MDTLCINPGRTTLAKSKGSFVSMVIHPSASSVTSDVSSAPPAADSSVTGAGAGAASSIAPSAGADGASARVPAHLNGASNHAALTERCPTMRHLHSSPTTHVVM